MGLGTSLYFAFLVCTGAFRHQSAIGSVWSYSFTRWRPFHSDMRPQSTVPSPETLCSLTATQVLELYRNDTIKVEDYARALLARVEERNSVTQAWAYYEPSHILQQARDLDSKPRAERGPLHGIAIGLKDIIDTKDLPTQFGSPLYKGFRPDFDASLVSILRTAGAIIFGKTTTTEFVVANSGPNTTNPRDPNRTPGGSSAGSAASVADLQVPLSFGTQNGGSIIRPAAYTGIFAMKPTINAISPEGAKLVSFNIDTCGYFGRSLDDLQLVADLFAFRQYDDPHRDLHRERTRVAFVKTPIWPKAGPSTIAAMKKAAEILEKHGIEVEEVDLPLEFGNEDTLKLVHKTVLNGDAEAAFLREYRYNKTQLSPKIRGLVENASNFTLRDIVRAMDRYAAMRPVFDDFAAQYSAIITPSSIDIAPLGLDDMGDSSFNFLWTGLHVPVVHIPAFIGAHHMPVGLSVVAGRYRDQDLLQICRTLSKYLMAEGGWEVVPPTKNGGT